ncbi:MAG: HAMP domain-containing histidine kinase, partial [Limnohabitans sp.]|nr:HAMP domain-containing histidine kinase [Limnohabitans sp.]
MKVSLKRRLYLHIIVITAAIILSNRFAAQSLLHGQLMDQGWEDLSEAVVQCESQLSAPNQFRHCAFDVHRHRITSMLTQDYALCPVGTTDATSDPVCSRLQGLASQWTLKEVDARGQRVELFKVDTPEGLWMGGRLKSSANAIQVWLPESSVANLRQRMWELRDRNLAYVLPFILTMLGFLTLWVAHLIMRPIRLLESTLSSVTSTNLGDSSNLEAPYVEFERIVSAFQDLRVRLRDSFAKARRFAADASHELRTPLTILRGNVEQLINQLPVGADSQVQMRMIGDEVERLIDITEKLLLLSRADGNSMVKEDSDFAISEFLEELVSDAHTFHPELVTRG